MGVDKWYGCECSQLAKETKNDIIAQNIECYHCGNIGGFSILEDHMQLNNPIDINSDNPEEYDWSAEFYCLIKCRCCNKVSICKFDAKGDYEDSYGDYIQELKNDEEFDTKARLDSVNFEIIYPHYNKNQIVKYSKVEKIFPQAMEIYRQAQIAELLNLNEVCGIGYRKSLEYLIKDYCIFKHKDKEEQIKNFNMAQLINEYIKDEKLRACANRAFWLGNDETHYNKKWGNKDINNLKELVEVSIKLIDIDLLSKIYEKEMPKPEK